MSTMPKILFAWRRSTPPFFMGGAEVSQRILAERLVTAGYDVSYLGSYVHPRDYRLDESSEMRSYFVGHGIAYERLDGTHGHEIEYSFNGIRCTMVAQEGLVPVLRRELRQGHDIVFCSQEGADEICQVANEGGHTVVGWIHSISPVGLLVLRGNPAIVLCTSEFVRQTVHSQFGIHGTLFYLSFEMPCPSHVRGTAMTLVNPVPEKGIDIFLALAKRLPERPFWAVEGWYPVAIDSSHSMRNVRYFTKQMNLASVYSETRLLLVPSHVDEGFGRVVVEAGLWGIPTIASSRGGLPEAVGPGGLLIEDHQGVDAWMDAVLHFDDANYYVLMAEAALRHAQTFLRNTVAELRLSGVL